MYFHFTCSLSYSKYVPLYHERGRVLRKQKAFNPELKVPIPSFHSIVLRFAFVISCEFVFFVGLLSLNMALVLVAGQRLIRVVWETLFVTEPYYLTYQLQLVFCEFCVYCFVALYICPFVSLFVVHAVQNTIMFYKHDLNAGGKPRLRPSVYMHCFMSLFD